MSILYRDVDFHGMTVQQINRDYFYSFQEGYFCSVVMKVDYYSDIVIGIRNHITDSLMIVIRECFLISAVKSVWRNIRKISMLY